MRNYDLSRNDDRQQGGGLAGGSRYVVMLALSALLASCQLMTGSDSQRQVSGDEGPGPSLAVDNPTLDQRCGLDAVLVLDASSSVRNHNNPPDGNGATDLIAGAGNAFLAAFSETNTRVAVVSYNANPIEQLGLVDVNNASLATGGAHTTAIGDPGGPSGPIPVTPGYSQPARSGSGTNWEAGLRTASLLLTSDAADEQQ